MNRDSSTGFFTGLIIGAIIGGGMALLYAPQPGQETRRLVKEKASEIKEKAVKAVSKIKESAGSYVKAEE